MLNEVIGQDLTPETTGRKKKKILGGKIIVVGTP